MDLIQWILLPEGGRRKEWSEQQEEQRKAASKSKPAGSRGNAGTRFAPKDGRHDHTSRVKNTGTIERLLQ